MKVLMKDKYFLHFKDVLVDQEQSACRILYIFCRFFFLTVLGMDSMRVDELLHKEDVTDYINICHLVKRPLDLLICAKQNNSILYKITENIPRNF